MVIVDTTVWIDYLHGVETPQTQWLDREITRQPLGITDLILCEVLQGIKDNRLFTQTRDELLHFHIFENGGQALAIASALNYRTLRGRGHTIRRTIDCLIATFCIEAGHKLLHHDRDFDVFEKELNLKVVRP